MAYALPQSSASQIPDFRSLHLNQLDAFIAQYLQPDEQFHSLVSSALDNLCRFLQNQLSPFVRRIVKSGSIAKGTALKNASDLDCVLIMNIITDAVQLRACIRSILNRIQTSLEGQPLLSQGWVFDIRKVDEYMLQFLMTNIFSKKYTKVDLLPTFDANVTNFEARRTLYSRMASLDETTRSYCSAALAELQRDFIIEKPAKLKDLIRLTKHWAKTYLPLSSATRRMPSSYLIELVAIHVWEQVGRPSGFNTAALFMIIMIWLCNYKYLDISWNRYYVLTEPASSPRILDPANPYNNIYEDVNDWETVARVARQTLQMTAMKQMAVVMLSKETPASALVVLAYLFSLYS